jgi:hypothetical protein
VGRTPATSHDSSATVGVFGGQWPRRVAEGLAVWFVVAGTIFALVRDFGIVAYLLAFCVLWGGATWGVRSSIRPMMARLGLDNLGGFVLLVIGVASLEEGLSDVLGGPASLVIRYLPLDLVWVNLVWLGWLLPWYLWVPRRYSFNEVEALLVGGSGGLLFEVVLSRVFLDPIVAVLWIPLAWAIYAVIFLLPLQLIRFEPRAPDPWRVPATLAVTWGGGIVVALVLYGLFAHLGLPT